MAEEEEAIQRGLAEMLTADDDVAAQPENGRQFPDAARTLDSDIVIADISMPVPDGLRAARRFIAEGIRAKVVFFTRNGRLVLVRRALRAQRPVAASSLSRTPTQPQPRPDPFCAPSSKGRAQGCVNNGPGEEGLPRVPKAVLEEKIFVSPPGIPWCNAGLRERDRPHRAKLRRE